MKVATKMRLKVVQGYKKDNTELKAKNLELRKDFTNLYNVYVEKWKMTHGIEHASVMVRSMN